MDRADQRRRGPFLWLAARSRRFLATVFSLPVLYVSSFGPACWLTAQRELKASSAMFAYVPIGAVICSERESPAREGFQMWMVLWTPAGFVSQVPADFSGMTYVTDNRGTEYHAGNRGLPLARVP